MALNSTCKKVCLKCELIRASFSKLGFSAINGIYSFSTGDTPLDPNKLEDRCVRALPIPNNVAVLCVPERPEMGMDIIGIIRRTGMTFQVQIVISLAWEE